MSKSKKHSPGYETSDLISAVKQQVLTGKATSQLLFEIPLPHKSAHFLKKALAASENWQLSGGTIWSCYGIELHAVASWGDIVSVQLGSYTHRFRILHLDRTGVRMVFSIPIHAADSLSKLPDIELSSNELHALVQMADDLGICTGHREHIVRIKHPARDTLKLMRTAWSRKHWDEQQFLELLDRTPPLLPMFAAALDAQLRAFKSFRHAPLGIYHFQIPKGTSDQWFFTVLSAITFTNTPGQIMDGPIQITLKDSKDWNRWRMCCGRLAIIQAPSVSSLWSLVEDAEEADRIQKSGGNPSLPFPTVPITLCTGVMHCPQAIDVVLPEAPPYLSASELDLLRTAIAILLEKEFAQEISTHWKRCSSSPTIYRENRFRLWQNLLCSRAIAHWFTNDKRSVCAKDLLRQRQEDHVQTEAKRQEAIHRALHLLADPAQYDSQIIERPQSKESAIQALSQNAMAFWYKPQKGADRGQSLLAFSEASLKRLLQQAECDETLYESFLRTCESEGLLDQRNRSITLGGETFNAITFRLSCWKVSSS